jgi:hypothetical protein
MKAIVKVSQEKKACLKAVDVCPEDMGANEEKSEAKIGHQSRKDRGHSRAL